MGKAIPRAQGERLIIPDKYRVVGLDANALQALFVQAPLEGSPPYRQ